MIRKIIEIDAEKCNGCGLCVNACHEGAIGLVNGKARLLRDDYCDGLGNCLPVCPTGAIGFVEREAAAFDAEAVEQKAKTPPKLPCGCPGSNAKKIVRQAEAGEAPAGEKRQSCLGQWPVQIQLVPVNAPYFEDASLLIAADCAAYAHADFHAAFMKNRITIIGCPKLDAVDYTEKLTAILKTNNIKSLAIVRMEVPCCAGIANAAIAALKASGKMIPWRVVTISVTGEILRDE
ncbi:MAG: 4Fe-4S binding protein [Treponema sp.]|jgi:NAD-dependent dihydropyrimidine dehydrogenase PreA subunit|nr:4Fe-4S binding protein [Treponema sp.]